MLKKVLESKFFFFTNSLEIKLLVIFGLFFRLVLFAFYLHSTNLPDSWSFIELGDRMLRFNISGYNGQRSPGYLLLYLLAFGSGKLVAVYQFFIGIITTVIVYKTLLKYSFPKKASFYITIFTQSFLHIFFYETAILVESLTLFLISLIFYLISDGYFENKTIRKEIVMALLLAFLVLVKPFYAYLPFIIYGFAVIKNFSFKKIISQKILILILPLFCYFSWSYVNKVNTGYFVSSTFLGLNIAQNCVHFAEKAPKEYDWIAKPYVKHREMAKAQNKDIAMTIWYAYEAGDFGRKDLSFADMSNELGKFGKETIKNNPKDYWKQVIFISWTDFWNVFDMKKYIPFRLPLADDFFSIIWIVQKAILTVFKYVFLLLVPYYFFLFFRNRKITNELVTVTVIFATSVLQAIVTFGTNSKYSFPFEYLMVIVVFLFVKNNLTSSKNANISQQ